MNIVDYLTIFVGIILAVLLFAACIEIMQYRSLNQYKQHFVAKDASVEESLPSSLQSHYDSGWEFAPDSLEHFVERFFDNRGVILTREVVEEFCNELRNMSGL